MKIKYKVGETTTGWVVQMAANGRIVESFDTEKEAQVALQQWIRGEKIVADKTDVWIVDGTFVCESSIHGTQLGEFEELDMNQYNVIQMVSQDEYDSMMNEFLEEHGHYPDQ